MGKSINKPERMQQRSEPSQSAPAPPSQALPRQLSRRESQAVMIVAKVLGIMRKLPAVLLALPLGELAKP